MNEDNRTHAETATSLLKLLEEIKDKLLMFGGARQRLLLQREAQEFAKLLSGSEGMFSESLSILLDRYLGMLSTFASAVATYRPELTDSEWSDLTVLTPAHVREMKVSAGQYQALLLEIEKMERTQILLSKWLRAVAGA